MVIWKSILMVLVCCVGLSHSMLSVPVYGQPPKQDLSSLTWLTGAWSGNDNGDITEEQWMAPRGGLMLGMNRSVSAAGRTGFEFLRIAQTKDGIAYYASPSGKPATRFLATELSNSKVIFENLENDFPQRIIYRREDEILHARIEGKVGGKAQSMEWHWKLTR